MKQENPTETLLSLIREYSILEEPTGLAALTTENSLRIDYNNGIYVASIDTRFEEEATHAKITLNKVISQVAGVLLRTEKQSMMLQYSSEPFKQRRTVRRGVGGRPIREYSEKLGKMHRVYDYYNVRQYDLLIKEPTHQKV